MPGPRPASELARYDRIYAERAGVPAPAPAPAAPGTALSVLAAVLDRDGQQHSAAQTRSQALADADHLALLHAIWAAETSPAREQRYRNLLAAALPGHHTAPGPRDRWLWRTLHGAELVGLDPAQVLADAIGEGDLAGARDIPAVIDTRIRNRTGALVPLPPGPWSAQGESEHTEIAAWCLETQAWQVLTAGDYQRAADISQAATTLSWLGDKAAEGLARQMLAAIEEPGARPRPRRAALARLDLALALTAADKHDEAAGMTLEAIRSGRLAPVDGRRPREIVLAVAERGVPEAAELTEAYQAACGDGGSRPALP